MDGDSAVDLQEMPVCINCRILVFRSPASKNGARAAKRKPVHPKHGNHLFSHRGAMSVPPDSSSSSSSPCHGDDGDYSRV